MTITICGTIDTLLASVQGGIDDSELSFKLRTAHQLNIACKEQVQTYTDTLEDANLDPDVVDSLKELGYL